MLLVQEDKHMGLESPKNTEFIKAICTRRKFNKYLVDNIKEMDIEKIGHFNSVVKDNRQKFYGIQEFSYTPDIDIFVNNLIDIYELQKTDPQAALEKATKSFKHPVVVDVLYDDSILEELTATYEELLPAKTLIEELNTWSLTKEEIQEEIKSLINFKTNQ